MQRYVAVRRDDIYSPNSVENDWKILHEACDRIRVAAGLKDPIPMIDESEVARDGVDADCIITMARSEAALRRLAEAERRGCRVVNSAAGVGRCQRSVLDRLMREHQSSMPPPTGHDGYWLKRGDASAQTKADVVYCEDEAALVRARRSFSERGINDVVISAHVVGDVVKFYGVGSGMFRHFYPTDDGISKFGDEQHNGAAQHFAFDIDALKAEVVGLAALVGVEVYGGDAVIDAQGHFYIIDFNDWPSFSRCREEAAAAIAHTILNPAGLIK